MGQSNRLRNTRARACFEEDFSYTVWFGNLASAVFEGPGTEYCASSQVDIVNKAVKRYLK